MSTTRRAGFWAMVAAFLGTAAGCGAAPLEAPAPVATYAPVAQAPRATEGEAPAAAKKADASRDEAPSKAQPGLGTEWGETRRSEISMVSFERADDKSPFAATSLLYNDAEGATAMTGGTWTAGWEMFDVGGGLVKVGLRDETGRLCPGFVSGKRNVVVGQAGHRYTVMVHNNGDRRMEVVLSVDGLDVLDGKTASFTKRGYILDAHGDLEIDGFRQSVEAVAAFRFGSVRGSYAGQKTGDTRNVGVIGVALFHEKGSMPFPWTPEEVRRRHEANPFPGEWATPPVR